LVAGQPEWAASWRLNESGQRNEPEKEATKEASGWTQEQRGAHSADNKLPLASEPARVA